MLLNTNIVSVSTRFKLLVAIVQQVSSQLFVSLMSLRTENPISPIDGFRLAQDLDQYLIEISCWVGIRSDWINRNPVRAMLLLAYCSESV